MARYTPADHDETVIPPLALGEGRDNADNEPADTSVVLNTPYGGGRVGDTVQVGSKRATWMIANGFATRPENWKDQYAQHGGNRPVTEEPEVPEEPDPEEGEPEV